MRKAFRPTLMACVLCSSAFLLAADGDADERALRDAGVGTTGEALLQFFRNRTVGEADRDKIAALIKQLADDDFGTREKASSELVSLGGRAEAQLRDAVKNNPDPEV